jgi:MFS family permease
MSAAVLAGIDLFQFYLPIYGHSIGLSATTIGVIIGLFSAAAFVVRSILPALSERLGEERVLGLALLVGAAGYLAVAGCDTAWLLGLVSFAIGLGLGAGQPLSTSLTHAYSPPGRTGEALGMRVMLNNVVHVGVPVIAGSIGTALGIGPIFWMNALILGAAGLLGRQRDGIASERHPTRAA